jgi:hypothetical protein
MYLVMRIRNDSGEISSCPIVVSDDRTKLEGFITERKKQDIRFEKLFLLMSEWSNQYSEHHPKPVIGEIFAWPRWEAGMKENQITPEMRAERNRIKEANAKTLEVGQQLQDKYNEQKKVDRAAYIETLKLTDEEREFLEDHPLWFSAEEFSYQIEEIDVI